MLFNSIEYLFFFIPIVFILYFVLNKFKFYNAAKVFLLGASLYFYGSYKWDYIYILIVTVLLNYTVSRIFEKDLSQLSKKCLLIFAIVVNAAILLAFKYFTFLLQALSEINFTYLSTVKIIMPLGISFFMIQQISYLVDCYNGKIKRPILLDYALFVCFFPQLIAGPIVRFKEMIPQFNNIKNKVINQDNIYIGLFLITAGLIKKTVFADSFLPFMDLVSMHKLFNDFYLTWLYGISKVLQGYFDFSSYCDLALGSAFLFNIRLPWNFNSPFQASNIAEFWKRYNMTLIRFLRIYIFNPLGGNTGSIFKTMRNIIIIFAVMGIWIGFNSMSIFYGIVNGICICINKLWQSLKIKTNNTFAKILTFLTVVFTSQFLSADSFPQILRIFKSMLCIDSVIKMPHIENYNFVLMYAPAMAKLNIILLLVGLILVFFLPNSNVLAKKYAKADNIFYTIMLIIVFLFGVLSITKGSEFIYFAF